MEPPIIINESSNLFLPGDVRLYATLEDAARSLEPSDLDGGYQHAFDSTGRVLRISTADDMRSVCFAATEEIQPEKFGAMLRKFLLELKSEGLLLPREVVRLVEALEANR
jgi:hypothetical protein